MLSIWLLSLCVLCWGGSISFLTHNMDDGTDFTNLTSTQDPAGLLLQYWGEVIASKPNERAVLIGIEILASNADIVALVEIPFYSITYPNGTVENIYDSLTQTMQIVQHRYRLVTVQELSSYPFFMPDLGVTLTFKDSQAFLVNKNSENSRLTISNVKSQIYNYILTVDSAIGPISFLRGWIQMDVTTSPLDKQLRVITTHTEVSTAEIYQQLEMQQIFAEPANTDLTVVLLGDFNSGPQVNPDVYNYILSNGLADAWHERTDRTDPGYTWAIFPEDGNPSLLDQQIDIIFYDNSTFLKLQEVCLVGGVPTPEGLYPADHKGVFAKFSYSNHD